MSVYAISDLHLPGGDKKPMDIFGAHWTDHFDHIRADWRERVSPADLVLLPGDISWAMHLSDALGDLLAIGELPGSKVILRGNHDYWWSAITRVREALPAGMYALQNDAIAFDEAIVCGSRGWVFPESTAFTTDDQKIYARELERLTLSLKKADALRNAHAARGHTPPLVAMLHYPPVGERKLPSDVTALLTRYGVCDAVYGHLHGTGLQGAFEGTLDGVRYHQTSCDGLGFKLYRLPVGA